MIIYEQEKLEDEDEMIQPKLFERPRPSELMSMI